MALLWGNTIVWEAEMEKQMYKMNAENIVSIDKKIIIKTYYILVINLLIVKLEHSIPHCQKVLEIRKNHYEFCKLCLDSQVTLL